MSKLNISRPDFLNGFALSVAAGGAFGSHACFYSDAAVLTTQASGCTPFQHAFTQIPYALIAAVISIVGYLLIAHL